MTSATAQLTVTADTTVQIDGKRSFSRCTFGSVHEYENRPAHVAYAERTGRPIACDGPRTIDYPWLNADAMVIDGRRKSDVPRVAYGQRVTVEGYGDFTIEPPARYCGGDSPQLKPAGRETTTDQERALARLSNDGDLTIEWTGARPYGEPMDDGDGVLEVKVQKGTDVPFNERYRTYHVFPSGRVRRVTQNQGGGGRRFYQD